MSESNSADKTSDEMTEIVVQPDGRVFVHSPSRSVLDVLESLQPADPALRALIQHVRGLESALPLQDPA